MPGLFISHTVVGQSIHSLSFSLPDKEAKIPGIYLCDDDLADQGRRAGLRDSAVFQLEAGDRQTLEVYELKYCKVIKSRNSPVTT